MDYRKESGNQGKGLISSVLLVLCSALLGGLLAVVLVPSIYGQGEVRQWGGNQVILQQNPADAKEAVIDLDDSPIVAVAEQVGPTVVGIANFQNRGFFFGSNGLTEVTSGSGFVIDSENGYIVTNNHVIAQAETLIISLASGQDVKGVVVGGDPKTDLAVIKIEETDGLRAVQIGDSNALKVGQFVVAIGNPGGQEFARTVTWGIVSATGRFLMLEGEASFGLIQTDAAINPGNSGGPLVNFQGQVVGINSAKNSGSGFEGMGFAIPITDALPVIRQLLEAGYVNHPALELELDTRYTEEYASYKGWPAGCYVTRVTVGGAADKAGIKAGDIIVTVGGGAVPNSLRLTHHLFKYRVGDIVEVTYYRNGETLSTSVILGEMTS